MCFNIFASYCSLGMQCMCEIMLLLVWIYAIRRYIFWCVTTSAAYQMVYIVCTLLPNIQIVAVVCYVYDYSVPTTAHVYCVLCAKYSLWLLAWMVLIFHSTTNFLFAFFLFKIFLLLTLIKLFIKPYLWNFQGARMQKLTLQYQFYLLLTTIESSKL